MSELVSEFLSTLAPDPDQALKLDQRLAGGSRPIDEVTRLQMWRTLGRTLDRGPTEGHQESSTGLLMGRIQSGKTTAMTGLCALAHDRGYRVVVAILGTTKLLLEQNTSRLLAGLGLTGGLASDYCWVHLDPSQERQRLSREVEHALGSQRTVLITVLKNSRRLQPLAEQLSRVDLSGVMALVLDDEADQASLNTLVADGLESPTYSSLASLAEALPNHLYLQVTATPFAPLLLEPSDRLSPRFVEFLEPGPGYTGAREFFVDGDDAVVRLVAAGEALRTAPRTLPSGLKDSLANYLLGAASLLGLDPSAAPVSMLVHPTHRIAIHERVGTLIRRELAALRRAADDTNHPSDLPSPFPEQYRDLLRWGVPEVDPGTLMRTLRDILRLTRVWVVNSAADQDSITWSSSPAHILVGGNKLDRGFTIEGLTVSYLSRSTSTQADTLAQRARAFGYRGEYLPYCRFFANSSTVDAFKSSVMTEEAMRTELQQWIAEDRDLGDWATHVGFVLGDGMSPTRSPVAPWIARTPSRGWHVLSNPELSDPTSIRKNESLLEDLGLTSAPREPYGRLRFRTLRSVSISRVARLLSAWNTPERSGWNRSDIVSFVARVADVQPDLQLDVALLDGIPEGSARVRGWREGIGFSNLMQGRDLDYEGRPDQYPGDRAMFGEKTGLQVHLVQPRGSDNAGVYTLALHIGEEILAATEVRRS